jgi:uncharacterized protein YfaS (alpha-2-macroglobulin family)
VDFNVVGYYLYGAPANGNSLQGQLFLRPLREAVAALPGFQFGDIAEENLSRSLDEVQLTLDEQGRAGFYRKPVERGALSAAADPAGQPAGIWRSSGDASR